MLKNINLQVRYHIAKRSRRFGKNKLKFLRKIILHTKNILRTILLLQEQNHKILLILTKVFCSWSYTYIVLEDMLVANFRFRFRNKTSKYYYLLQLWPINLN